MSYSPAQVRCPHCHQVNLAPPQGSRGGLWCPVCGQRFFLPPSPPSGPSAVGPLPPHLRASAPVPPTPPPPETAEKPPRRSPLIGWAMRLSLVAIVGSLIVGVALIPRAVKQLRQQRAARPQVEPPPPDVVEIVDLRPVGEGPEKWIDAARSAGLRSGMHVRIIGCRYGEVLARDANGQPFSPPGEFLQIRLRVTNRLKTSARYISWHANHFRDGTTEVAAKLTDDDGREYPSQRFSGVRSLDGHVDNVTLAAGESTEDVVIFALPQAKGSGNVPLKLQLPAAAVARTGWFDFKLTAPLWEQ